MEWIKVVLLPFVITLVTTPLVIWIAKYIDAYAKINERTVHTRKNIARIGGVAIYVAFMISMTCFMKSDTQIRGLLLGSSIMFFGGLVDDLVNLSPKKKLAFQAVASFVVIFYGNTMLGKIFLPYGIVIDMGLVSYLITFLWLTGITNAVNLIDGLDGLASGISLIILVVVASLCIIDNRPDIMIISLILVGSLFGFLIFNSYPAKVFLGDCGALFLGFMLANISLMGFKSSTFITLGLPILMCGVPIVDTLSAILRRKLSGKKIDQADKNHLHHVLMRKFGHKNTVLILYAVTLCSGIVAYIYILNNILGLILLCVELIVCEMFLEKTQMIATWFHPVTSIVNFVKKYKKIRKKS